MTYYNLTDEQKTALKAAVGRFTERPTWNEYIREEKILSKIGPSKFSSKGIKHSINNHIANAFGDKWPKPTIIPQDGFTEADLPPCHGGSSRLLG